MSGPSHGSPVRPALWKAKSYVARPRRPATSAAVPASSSGYGVALGDDARRQAVGGEHDADAGRVREAIERLRGGRGQRVDEARLVVPGVDEGDGGRGIAQAGQRGVDRAAVAGGVGRALRRERDRDEALHAVRGHLLDDRPDPRRDVAHPGVDGDRPAAPGELRLHRRALQLDDPREGRAAADRPVASQQLLEQVGRRRAAAADVGVVGLHLVEPVGAAVGHEQDGVDGHAGILPGSVRVDQVHQAGQRVRVGAGKDAVPEVEDVARTAAGRVEDRSRVAGRPPRTGRGAGRGRGSPARRGPGRRRASPRPARSASRGR